MRDTILKPKPDISKVPNKIPSIHRYKLSLDMSLINAPNKNISEFNLPSQKHTQDSYLSKSKRQIIPSFISVKGPPSKSYKKYFPSSLERGKNYFPMSGNETIRTKNDNLSEYELRELPNYSEVYYIGDFRNKIHGSLSELNWGYDDEDANYKIVIGDHIDYRYEVLSLLGKGSFGQVSKCFDHKTSEIVAIKILKNKNKFHKQGEVEAKILKVLNFHDPNDCFNVVKMITYFTFRCHLCLVFELLHISLFDFIRRNRYRGFYVPVIKKLALQLVRSLKFIKENSVIHCDLKPENILFKTSEDLEVKIIDFGSGCFENKRLYTYIQSRFYRSPEIMLGILYTPAIDMWSLGCILVELYRGYPLFPGKDEEDQMGKILEVLGVPPRGFVMNAARKLNFFDKFGMPLPSFDSKGHMRILGSNSLKKMITESEEFLDFVEKCLKWDPEERLTPEQALKHGWLLE